jgi:hypothetical protein
MAEAKFRTWVSKIETAEEARKVIKEASSGFFIVAALQAALSVVILKNLLGLVDVALMVVGALLLRAFNSRAAAVGLLVLALAEAGTTFANRFGAELGGGNNVFLALVMLWIALRAVQATFKLKRLSTTLTPTATPAP